MEYKNIKSGIFKSRPNRFIAHVEIDGNIEVCHVKNTGRCRELLTPDCTVYLEESSNPNRKTKFDLIAVLKGDRLFNIDSQAPNKVFGEWIKCSKHFGEIKYIKPEYCYKSSRLDFYAETETEKILIEVKGVTLEENGVLMFPDAPTQRGIKHIKELIGATDDGYRTAVAFVIQTDFAEYFTPNNRTHPEFGQVLKEAHSKGVEVLALSCSTSPNSLKIQGFVPVEI